ncbi:MAG: hypothetical protein ACE366_27775 [Bradymonadia bacterium]
MTDTSTDQLERFGDILARRALAMSALQGLGPALGIGAVVAVFSGWPWALLGGGGVLVGWVMTRRCSHGVLMARADAALGMQQGLVCAWDRREEPGPFEVAQRRQIASKLRPEMATDVCPRPHWAWAFPAALCLLPVWASGDGIPNGTREAVDADLAGVAKDVGQADSVATGPTGGTASQIETSKKPEAGVERPRIDERPDAGLAGGADAGMGAEPSGKIVRGQAAGVGGRAGRLGAGGPGRRRVGAVYGEAFDIELRPLPQDDAQARQAWATAGDTEGLPATVGRWPARHHAVIRAWLEVKEKK